MYLTMRYQQGDYVVTGPDIEPVKFETSREAWVWCLRHYPGSPVKQVGANVKAAPGKAKLGAKAGDRT